ncbi:MAG: hypothetical protein ACTSW4_02320 [Candidatus Ranarchaeia archaeon]
MIHAVVFEKIEGQRTIQPGEKISRLFGFQHNNRVTNVSTVSYPPAGKKVNVLKLDFVFTTTYNPPIASIILGGHVLYSSSSVNPEEIVTHWRKTNNLPEEVAKEIIGNIIPRGIQKATVISDQLNIPPPIPLPQARPGKIGSKEKESPTNTSFLV